MKMPTLAEYESNRTSIKHRSIQEIASHEQTKARSHRQPPPFVTRKPKEPSTAIGRGSTCYPGHACNETNVRHTCTTGCRTNDRASSASAPVTRDPMVASMHANRICRWPTSETNRLRRLTPSSALIDSAFRKEVILEADQIENSCTDEEDPHKQGCFRIQQDG